MKPEGSGMMRQWSEWISVIFADTIRAQRPPQTLPRHPHGPHKTGKRHAADTEGHTGQLGLLHELVRLCLRLVDLLGIAVRRIHHVPARESCMRGCSVSLLSAMTSPQCPAKRASELRLLCRGCAIFAASQTIRRGGEARGAVCGGASARSHTATDESDRQTYTMALTPRQ